MTKRCAVIKLWNGTNHYLTRSGRPGPPLILHYEHARSLLAHMRPQTRDHSDPLHGASVEVLPKRKKYAPLSEEEFQHYLHELRAQRLLQEADKWDRWAEAALWQAQYETARATDYRARARKLREESTK